MSSENWATIDPEGRLYKGKKIFRWDDSPGLEHHCGTCAKPLHNARAKTSCIGKHVEPCYRFHQQLHFVGKSQECFGCNSADEMHHKRHKEILQLVRQITEIDMQDRTITLAPSTPNSSKSTRKDSITTASTLSANGSGSITSDNDGFTKTRKKVRTSPEATITARREIEVFPRVDFNFISYALHKSVHDSKGARAGTYNYSNPNLTTVKQHERVIEKNSKGTGSGKFLPEEDEETIDLSVKAPKVGNRKTHKKKTLGEKQLQDMTPRQRRVQNFMYSRSGNSRKFDPERMIKSDLYSGVDAEVFFRLGIEVVNPKVNSRERKSLVAKLVAGVKEDILIQEREAEECQMREDGFWRWAGNTACSRMRESREGIDWATGMKFERLKAAGFMNDDEDEHADDQKDGGYKADGDDPFEYFPGGWGMELEPGFNVMNTTTSAAATDLSSLPGSPVTPAETPVKFKCYAPVLRLIDTHKPAETPHKKSRQKPNSIVSFDDKVFAQASCPRPYGKPILYSKAVTSNLSFLDYTEDFAVSSCNQPAESFTQKEDFNDDQGWATVGKGGKSVPVVPAKSMARFDFQTSTPGNAKTTKSTTTPGKRKKT